ncbi:Retinoblastoma-like protein 2 [Orchesella cincta]|uniref:Retinoblastoma-like protein 2 n=1 Tax=Orchesella cincta TaxID=48709 RepID=A0A1D2N076_ORCCI|nr:Retinoblastoma-like protein 2 [Orchesella cincta]
MSITEGVITEGEIIVLPEIHHIVDEAYERFQELCADLNLDAITKENTWRTFVTVKQKFTLEGDPAHWLCCAIYVACRQACVPSVAPLPPFNGNSLINTNSFELQSLVDFFDTEQRKWAQDDEQALNQEFLSQIEVWKRHFAVDQQVIFKKFEAMLLVEIFKRFSRVET